MERVLQHHGILGQKWGVRRTPEQLGHLSKKDSRWVAKKSDKITAKAKKQSQRELNKYGKELMREPGATNKNGQLSAKTINAYNRRMAELMSTKVSDLRSPSGKVVTFVAKRGEVGVFMALADEGYNMQQLKNGVYDSGRVAYKKDVVDKVEHSALSHHGVKDQKWGVKNGPPYPLDREKNSTPTYNYGKMNLSSSSLPTVTLPKQEYAHVMSEVATHVSDEQRRQPVFQKAIGNFTYTFENGFDGTYRVIDQAPITDDAGILYERWIDDD